MGPLFFVWSSLTGDGFTLPVLEVLILARDHAKIVIIISLGKVGWKGLCGWMVVGSKDNLDFATFDSITQETSII